jgi:hypothetical protein
MPEHAGRVLSRAKAPACLPAATSRARLANGRAHPGIPLQPRQANDSSRDFGMNSYGQLVRAGKVADAEASRLDYWRSRATMPVYRLTPVNPNDPNWRTSIHRAVAVIRAGSEEQARSLASNAFDTTLAPSSPGGKIATPLWQQSYAVRVEVIQDQRYGSEGPAGILEPWGYS